MATVGSKMRLAASVAVCAFAIMATGCLMAPVVPPMGSVYTQIEAPLDLSSAGGKEIGPKCGEASSFAILGIFASGDASIHAAAENGGIRKVNHVDYRFKNVLLGAYSRYTTVVYGE